MFQIVRWNMKSWIQSAYKEMVQTFCTESVQHSWTGTEFRNKSHSHQGILSKILQLKNESLNVLFESNIRISNFTINLVIMPRKTAASLNRGFIANFVGLRETSINIYSAKTCANIRAMQLKTSWWGENR